MRLLAGTAGAATAVSLSDSSSGLDNMPPHGDMSELEECVRVLHAKLDELQQKRNSGAPLEEDLTAFSVELDRLLDEKSKFDSKSQELRNCRSAPAVRSISRQSSLAPAVQRVGQISPVKMRPPPALSSTRMSRSPTNGSTSMSLSGSVQIPVPNSVRVSSPARLRSARPTAVTGSSVRLLPNTSLASSALSATAPLPSGPLAAASLPGTPLTGTPISSLSLPPGNALVAAPVPPLAQVLPTQIPSLPPFLAASASQQFLVSTPMLVPMGPQQLFLAPAPSVARRGSPKSERPHSARRSRHREADACCAGWG